jgi:hypothetical protein
VPSNYTIDWLRVLYDFVNPSKYNVCLIFINFLLSRYTKVCLVFVKPFVSYFQHFHVMNLVLVSFILLVEGKMHVWLC